MRIGLDLDSTLIVNKAIDVASKELGYDYKEESNTDYRLDCFPLDLKNRIFELFVDPIVTCGELATPIEDSQETIKKWYKEGHNLILITARSHLIQKDTIDLVNRLYPEIEDVITVGINKTKKQYFIDKKIERWVDDNPSDLITAKELGIKSYMISNKYTKYNHYLRNQFPWFKKISEINF